MNTNKIENFLRELDTEIDVLNFVDIEYIDPETAFEDIYSQIEDKGGFEIDIIYYSEAIKYLAENDSSLRESLDLAAQMCLSVENLNSETLASLLASQNARENFSSLEDEINSFFEDLVQTV